MRRKLKVVLSVNVDDFAMAVCAQGLPEAWKSITDHGQECGQNPRKMTQEELDQTRNGVHAATRFGKRGNG